MTDQAARASGSGYSLLPDTSAEAAPTRSGFLARLEADGEKPRATRRGARRWPLALLLVILAAVATLAGWQYLQRSATPARTIVVTQSMVPAPVYTRTLNASSPMSATHAATLALTQPLSITPPLEAFTPLADASIRIDTLAEQHASASPSTALVDAGTAAHLADLSGIDNNIMALLPRAAARHVRAPKPHVEDTDAALLEMLLRRLDQKKNKGTSK